MYWQPRKNEWKNISLYSKPGNGLNGWEMENCNFISFKRMAEKRYSEILKEVHTITEMTLSLQLKKLEKDGLIKRKVFGKKPPVKVIYNLTAFGETIIPVLEAITAWGNLFAEQKGEFVTHSPLK